ncbi:MAG: DNA gyrase subunit A [Neisseriaceae bacterium]|nr:MAG: DNA gyrase subunit A [Neisseriaceae bacterium]
MSESFVAKETFPISLEEEMKQSYLDYAMSVIVGRALPDVRDGMKPVHRRVLYAMNELSNYWNKPFKKSARVVGNVIGKYHPHGDKAVYDTIVRMAQDFTMRYQLIDGQGNFGSIDGDGAAAMRYTEIRMHKIAQEILADLDKETVDFSPNYDNSEKEPVVLPSKIPILLVNGSSGIAVGMATNIPPHNISEVIDACVAVLDNEDISVDELIDIIPAPDFPTGATVYGISGIREGYRTGRGRVVIRGKTHIETIHKAGDRTAIVIDEIPYQVNKAKLVEKIGLLVRDKSINGIADLRDESDKSGIRIVIELKRNENAKVILNQLYKLTKLQDTFGINMVALVDGNPKQLNLKCFIVEFLKHRREVVYRRTVFELKKARNRGHVLEGLAVALTNVDEIIQLIKSSTTPWEAKTALLARTWRYGLVASMLERVDINLFRSEEISEDFGLKADGYQLSEVQAQAILDMRLQRLTGLEQDKIISEYEEVIEVMLDLTDVLAKRERVTEIIRHELNQIKIDFGDARKTEIDPIGGDIDDKDLIQPQDMIVTLSHEGYIKAQPVEDYQSQNRGGRGKQATATKEEDFIKTLFVANMHDYLLCFTSLGKCYWIKVYKLPIGSRVSRGRPVTNVLNLSDNETISAILPVKEFTDSEYVFMCTSLGIVKKTSLMNFSGAKNLGIAAITLSEQDSLVGVVKTSGMHEIMLFSDRGKVIRFDENGIRPTGRTSQGVRGMRLSDGSKVISLLAMHPETDKNAMVLTATENGYGKRTNIDSYPKGRRGNYGVIDIDTGQRNGMLVAASLVEETDDVMLITSGGILIRTYVNQIRETGRRAQGVRLINLDRGETLVCMEKVAESKEETEELID